MICLSCDSSQQNRIVEIYNFIPIELSNYKYSNSSNLILGKEEFLIKEKAVYDNLGFIKKLFIYKSEGVVEYSKEELIMDMKILDYLKIPIKQNWIYYKGNIIKGSNIIPVEELHHRYLKPIDKNYSFIYKY
jgi:hypothetical protein